MPRFVSSPTTPKCTSAGRHVAGVEAIKDAIQAIPAGDRHTLHEFWDLGGVKVTWGKTSAGTPFTFLLYMSEDGKVRTFRVTSGP